MSEDKQLTVAELLARAGGNPNEKPGEGQVRPRRRRSLEEGGVSVAELTGSIKKVEARPAEVKHSNVPIDAPAAPSRPSTEGARPTPVTVVEPATKPAAPKPAPVKTDETALIQKVGDTPASPSTTAASGSSRISSPVPASTEDTGVIPAVEAGEPRPAAQTVTQQRLTRVDPAEDTGNLERVGDDVETRGRADVDLADEAVDDDSALNPILLVLLVFAGVVVGILGFLAFQWVWAHLKTVFAALLALAAVLAVVFGVRSMRTGRDTLTTVLAGVAGVVMAFGPALIV